MGGTPQPIGPDLTGGIAEEALADGALLEGHVGEAPVLLVRRGAEIFAIDAICTHYGGPLRDGIVVGDTVRCPWHHACFSLRTGEALTPPAVVPVRCWRVERRDGRLYVRERIAPTAPAAPKAAERPAAGKRASAGTGAGASAGAGAAGERIVIIGGGAAGFGAAEMLRREGYAGEVTIVSDEDSPPYDRPNLSKDYLAGAAPEEWMPLEPKARYAEQRIELRLGTTVTGIDPRAHRVTLDRGGSLEYTRLLLATGAEPVRLKVPGADLPHVATLRSLADCRGIVGLAARGKRAVVIGASFIGLESAAALRQREVDVHVVAPEQRPLERVLGPALGDLLRSLHEAHGVVFHLGRQVAGIEGQSVRLDDGSRLDADLVLVGIGVRPRLALAEQAGLALDRGVLVDEYLRTSAPDIFAAGDIARWPDPYSGERLRIEHWVVAERQGQTAARNMLGRRERYAAVPFFWTQHYDLTVNYVGHAAAWDRIDQRGDVPGRNAALRFEKDGRTLAVATVFRDRESLEAELAMEGGRSP